MRRQASEPAIIPNIDFGRTFDLRDEDQDVHSESLGRLAEHFGRDMAAHRHDRVYQLHLLASGSVRLYLDEQFHAARAPLLFLTPPAVTHAFVISDDAEGQVISVRQELVWELCGGVPGNAVKQALAAPLCMELDRAQPAIARLLDCCAMLAHEYATPALGRELNLAALARLVFMAVARLGAGSTAGLPPRQGDTRLFQRFTQLIEEHYRAHWALGRYAERLNLTETRLNEICRRMAGMPSKRLVHERLLQEAKRQLMFTTATVSAIAYDLGFKDVSYFSRFFRLHAGCAPGDWRLRAQARQP